MRKLRIYTDGGSRSNPGQAACAFVVFEEENGAWILREKCGYFLNIATNNVAEYQGLIKALEWLISQQNIGEAEFLLDSLLVVSQIEGKWKIKDKNLYSFWEKARALFGQLGAGGWRTACRHVPREQNSIADSMVNQVLDREQEN